MEKSPEIGIGHNTTFYRENNTRIARWWSPDPKKELYYSWSSYSMSMDNPIVNNDPSGATIGMPNSKIGETDYGQKIIDDWQNQGGLNISRDKDGILSYTVNNDAKNYSETARKHITDAIDSEHLYKFEFGTKGQTMNRGNKEIFINVLQIQAYIDGASSGLDNRTLGFGMASIHELLHTESKNPNPSWDDQQQMVANGEIDLKAGYGFGGHINFLDNNPKSYGYVDALVSEMNSIRFELTTFTSQYGMRLSYRGALQPITDDEVYEYIPFDINASEMMHKSKTDKENPENNHTQKFPENNGKSLFIKTKVRHW